MKPARLFVALLVAFAVVGGASGCKKSQVEQALDSDANGYFCPDCKAKFYTARDIFPTQCPECKKPRVEMVLGFVCPADQHVTLAPRGKGTAVCEQCGKATSSLSIPREADLKTWGAVKRTAAEVGG